MGFEKDKLPDPVTYYESEGLVLQGRGKWRTTRCESHGGSDSMRINTETGAFCCMAGCGLRGGDVLAYQMQVVGQDFVSAARVLGAWVDDKPDPNAVKRKPLPFNARDALEILATETNLVAIAAGNVANNVQLTPEDLMRVLKAAGRIQVIQEACT